MNKRINDLIINLNNSENKTTDLKRNSLLSDEIEEQKSATTDEIEEQKSATADEIEEQKSATADEVKEAKYNSTKINKPLCEISKPYRVSIRGKILNE
jgi:flagellar motility protein MotE (MotC chaperone)